MQINQIVKGQSAGHFVVLALRAIGGVDGAQVKPVHPVTQKPARGEFWLPLTALKAA